MSKIIEPLNITPHSEHYASDLSRAFSWYNREKDKKDARAFLKTFLGREKGKNIDRVPDKAIVTTYGWIARMKANGNTFRDTDEKRFQSYLKDLVNYKEEELIVVETAPVVERPSVRDYMEEKVKEYLGELEAVLDSVIYENKNIDMFKDMQARGIPAQYCSFASVWVKRKAGEFISVYETSDKEVRAAYEHIGKRGLTSLIKTLNTWLQDIERYSQFKKANRKPRAKKIKPPSVQVAKLLYKKSDEQLGFKSVNPVELIGASQVWVFNTKYRKLAVYRSDSRDGIQVKGTTLQNYDPAQCEQKTINKPQEILNKVLSGGKIALRRIFDDLKTKSSSVNGRLSEDWLIIRTVR